MSYLRHYKQSRNLLARLGNLQQSVFNGFWLGILNAPRLHEIDESYYHDAVSYLARDYNKKGLKSWELEMVEKYFSECRHLLLIGAGGGREAYALQKMGYTVEAYECNEKLRTFGNLLLAEEGLAPCIEHLGRDLCPVGKGGYDGVIVGWGAYALIQSRASRVAFLKSIRSQIKEDTRILLSFVTRKEGSRELKATFLIGNALRTLLRREHLQLGDTMSPTYLHFFTESEVKGELREAGFDPLYFSDKKYGHTVARAAKT